MDLPATGVPVAELVEPPVPGPPSSASRARPAVLFLWLTGAAFAFGALVLLWGLVTGSATSVIETPGEPITALQATFAGFSCLLLVIILPTPVLFLLWLHRAKQRQQAYGSTASPGWAVLVWFVPVLSIVAPYREMQDLFDREEARPTDRRPLLGLWWTCLIASALLGVVGWVVHGSLRSPSPHPAASQALSCASYALLALAASLAARFITEFERRTARRSELPRDGAPA